MLLFAMTLLLSYWLFAYIRGGIHLTHLSRADQTIEAAQESHAITHALISSALPSLALALAICGPIHLGEWLGFLAHTHPGQSDLLHRALPSSPAFPGWLGLFAVGAFVLCSWFHPLLRWYKVHRAFKTLRHVPQPHESTLPESLEGIFQGPILLTSGAWCGLVGVIRPRLLLGTELLSSLEHDELIALLTHEEAHRQRRDPLYRVLLLFSSRLLPWLGARLFHRWELRIEELCDQYAAHQLGDSLTVANALIKTRKLQLSLASQTTHPFSQSSCPISTGFTQSSRLETRVQCLIELEHPPAPTPPPDLRHFFSSKLALSILVLQIPLHHTIERVFSLIH